MFLVSFVDSKADFVNLMAFDMSTSAEEVTAHHSPLYADSAADSTVCTV